MIAYNLQDSTEVQLLQAFRSLSRCEQLVILATAKTLARRHATPASLPLGVIDISTKRTA